MEIENPPQAEGHRGQKEFWTQMAADSQDKKIFICNF